MTHLYRQFLLYLLIVLIVRHESGANASTSTYQTLKQKQQRQKEKAKGLQDEMLRRKQLDDERQEYERHQRRRANEDMAFYDPPLLQSAEVPQIVHNDRLLFVGHRNVLYGSLYPYGFINLLEQQFKKMGLQNITVRSVGSAAGTAHLLDSTFPTNQDPSERFIPTKTIMLLGNEIFEPFASEGGVGFITVRQNVESMVATFVRHRIPVVLGTLFVSGEKYDGSNPNDPFFEEWQGILRRISITYDNVSYIDFSQSMQKYWETKNVDNVDHSILTHDGEIFNEEGHAFIACQLLQMFKLMEKPFVDDVSSIDMLAHMDILTNYAKRGVNKDASRRLIYNSPLWDKLVDNAVILQRRKDMEEAWLG
jgi:hypothetical protein